MTANERIELHAISQGIHSNRSDILPGAAFAIVKVDQVAVKIIQGADCFAVWLGIDGTVGATRNQVFLHDLKWRQIMANLLQKYGGDRERAWQDLMPVLAAGRLERVNQKVSGYALLNGQPTLSECWQKIILLRDEIKLLLLFTDGLIPFKESGNTEAFGKVIVNLFIHGGLEVLLDWTRSVEEVEKSISHIDHAEATGIAIEF